METWYETLCSYYNWFFQIESIDEIIESFEFES